MARVFLALAMMAALEARSATALAAMDDVQPGQLRIELLSKNGRKSGNKKSRTAHATDFHRACDALGLAMGVGTGPYAFGAFTSYSCYRDGKPLDGASPDKAPWTLTMVDGEDQVTLTLLHAVGDDQVEVTHVSMGGSTSSLKFFQDQEFTDLVSFALLSSSPLGMAVTKERLQGDPQALVVPYWRAGTARNFKFTVPKAPDELVLYRLRWDDSAKVWRSEVLGNATKEDETRPKRVKNGKLATLKGGQVSYKLPAGAAEAIAAGGVWAQDSTFTGKPSPELTEAIADAQHHLDGAAANDKLDSYIQGQDRSLLTHLLETTASGYIGMRYGLEVIPGVGNLGRLLNKTRVFGLLAEIRGGPLEGLRYYYDVLPKTTLSLAGETGPVNASIAFSRHVLAYSFDFNPGHVVDRITVTPKLGMWTFNATLPTVEDAAGNVQEVDSFNLGRTFNLALEAGVEEISSWYTLRAYYALNSGFSVVKTGGKITSNSFGVDAYFTAGPTFNLFGMPLKTALLAFYFYDAITLANGASPAGSGQQATITGITYDSGYAGGGVAVSW